MKYCRTFERFAIALFLLVCTVMVGRLPAQVIDNIDWKNFLSRHDMVWKRLPDRFENAAFTGNGHLGAMVFSTDKSQSLKWQMGRSDVVFGTSRIPIGDFLLTPLGKITAAEMRLDLYNAEVRGKITTDKGWIDFRSFTHSTDMINVFETIAHGGEKAAWAWSPGLATEPRKLYRKEPITDKDRNDPPVAGREGDIEFSFQPLQPSGGHTTAWKIVEAKNGRTTVYAAVGYAKQEAAAKAEAVAAVKQAVATGATSLSESHRVWWNKFWPTSFVSVPDARIESFYHIQMYKMASATRPGRPAMDLMGPWFRTTPWAKIWWNLNIQLAYWPQLTANRLELGESLCELIDNQEDALAKNAGPFASDSAGVGRATGYDCVGGVDAELCNLPWTMHNYWLQYRYSMDDGMLRRLFPMLKRSINYYLHLLKEGPDGKLHITRGLSPEYEGQPNPNPDCNIDLSLLRWGCDALLSACDRLKLEDPQIQQWKDTLTRLTPYPRDENGLKISATVPFTRSHRHYSHLVMIYPLYIMTLEQPENRDLVIQSLKHWMSMPQRLAGYSYTGAASISALLGDGDEAVNYLNKLLDSKIPPNTLYVESGPCIETPLSAAASLNDMLLSSWGDRIRVFPGVPKAWKDISFHNLRTQGAFLVSARREDGKTQWVRVKSLANEPCRIRPGLDGTVKATVPIRPADNGAYDLKLAKGQEAVLYIGDTVPNCTVAPVATDPGRSNFYGLPLEK
ncbi:MAG: alpha-L-fucosidase [Gloeobacteraceae cyanobacterium ES-bin-144]|nr:alpha-L-fucosidase [Verrucomicrobiales bacterium]